MSPSKDLSSASSQTKREEGDISPADSGALFSSEPSAQSRPSKTASNQASDKQGPVFSSEHIPQSSDSKKEDAAAGTEANPSNASCGGTEAKEMQVSIPSAEVSEKRVEALISEEESDPVEDALGKFSVQWKNTLGEPEEGPLDVLWDLIESYKVDIFDVSLMRITEDFLQFLQAAEDLQIELASSFAVMASRLLFYKSKALLPDPGFEEDEEEPGLPPELVEQLLEHRKFQKAADRLRQREEIASGILPREKVNIPEHIVEDGEWLDVSLVDLIAAYSRLLQRIEKEKEPEKKYTVELEEFSVEEKMEFLRGLLEKEPSFIFEDAFSKDRPLSRGELVATFLALLELTKQGEIIIRQKANFDEIRVFKKTVVVR